MTSHMTHVLGMDNQKHSFRRVGFDHCQSHTLKESFNFIKITSVGMGAAKSNETR